MYFKKELCDILKLNSNIKFGYLFGSFASNIQHKNSDIDIALYFKDGIDMFDEILKVHHQLEIKLNKQIDIVNLNEIKNIYLLEDILKNNILLKDSLDDSRIMFEIYKHHQVLDFKEYRKFSDVA